jgi:uncharacterized protein (TIGR02246 family)
VNRLELIDLTRRFVDAFNRNDLDAVIGFFAEDGLYDEFNGRRNVGKDAIRSAFTPQFTGTFGTMRFLDQDLFVDPDCGKVMVVGVANSASRANPPHGTASTSCTSSTASWSRN